MNEEQWLNVYSLYFMALVLASHALRSMRTLQLVARVVLPR